MAANRWSRRRRTIKRPTVCKSIAPQDKEQQWPPSLDADPQWQVITPFGSSQRGGGFITMTRIAGGPEYGAILQDFQNNHCVLTVFLSRTPGSCQVFIEIATGPLTGVDLFGLTPGWDGNLPWLTQASPLTPIGAIGGGAIDLWLH